MIQRNRKQKQKIFLVFHMVGMSTLNRPCQLLFTEKKTNLSNLKRTQKNVKKIRDSLK